MPVLIIPMTPHKVILNTLIRYPLFFWTPTVISPCSNTIIYMHIFTHILTVEVPLVVAFRAIYLTSSFRTVDIIFTHRAITHGACVSITKNATVVTSIYLTTTIYNKVLTICREMLRH